MPAAMPLNIAFNLRAFLAFKIPLLNRSISNCSPPKATTVRMLPKTSSATFSASEYDFISLMYSAD